MILAGITLYEPDLERLKENIESIRQQVDLVLCIDNGSKNITDIKAYLGTLKEIVLIENNENLGIAKALNQMYAYAEKLGYEWVLTLDQDSVCPANLISEYRKYMTFDGMGMLCPVIKDRNYMSDISLNGEYEYVERCITSASLTSVETWKNVGGFCEELFIDFVDHDFCARLIENNYKIIQVNTTCLLHEIGHGENHSFCGRRVTALNHTAFRKYYMARNWYYYIKKHRTVLDVKQEWMKYCFFFLKTLLYEKEKLKKMKAMFKGLKDGKALYNQRSISE